MEPAFFDGFITSLFGLMDSAISIPEVFSEEQFDAFASQLFELQFAHNPAYQTLCRKRGTSPGNVHHWREIPVVPTVGFKELEMTSLPAQTRTTVFHSSGTTEQRPSRHYHNPQSLKVYEKSLWSWFAAHLLGNCDLQLEGSASEFALVILSPPPGDAPHSSLVHMFEVVRRKLAAPESCFCARTTREGWVVDAQRTTAILKASSRPVLLLGTAFSFIHLLDWMHNQGLSLSLPSGSRIMETGGYKGRSRSVPKEELHSMFVHSLGVPPRMIVSEYGMSELSSQAYDCVAGADLTSGRTFRFPPWTRVRVISPETGGEVAEGEKGVLAIYDLANIFSVMAVQTEDMAVRRGNGFELLGRAQYAEPRGCSLMTIQDMG